MPFNFDQIKFIIGDEKTIQNMKHLPAYPPFHPSVVDYLEAVAKILLKTSEAKQYPDIITYGFWCRKASVELLKKPYSDIKNRLGRGVAFHIAPSNVAVNFAYSLTAGILAGDANILRIPSKDFEQVKIICSAFQEAMNDEIRPYICLVQYGHNQDINDYFSAICDTRIIWGGDETIAAIRKSPLKARATEITFADRYSLCLINADEYLKEADKQNVAKGFYNDTYLTDQNACTSPRVIVWIGKSVQEAQSIFWEELYRIVRKKYVLQPVQAVNKYSTLCRFAAEQGGVHMTDYIDNLIIRVKVNTISGKLVAYIENSGYFIECEAKKLNELLPLCTSQCQTLSYYGIEKKLIEDFLMTYHPQGIDKVVPIGKTMDFALIWDGFDLIRSLSREISS